MGTWGRGGCILLLLNGLGASEFEERHFLLEVAEAVYATVFCVGGDNVVDSRVAPIGVLCYSPDRFAVHLVIVDHSNPLLMRDKTNFVGMGGSGFSYFRRLAGVAR